MPQELGAAIDGDLYSLHTDCLEEEGIVLKSGLTPTDMMVIKGDFNIYDPRAAKAAVSLSRAECGVRRRRRSRRSFTSLSRKRCTAISSESL